MERFLLANRLKLAFHWQSGELRLLAIEIWQNTGQWNSPSMLKALSGFKRCVYMYVSHTRFFDHIRHLPVPLPHILQKTGLNLRTCSRRGGGRGYSASSEPLAVGGRSDVTNSGRGCIRIARQTEAINWKLQIQIHNLLLILIEAGKSMNVTVSFAHKLFPALGVYF